MSNVPEGRPLMMTLIDSDLHKLVSKVYAVALFLAWHMETQKAFDVHTSNITGTHMYCVYNVHEARWKGCRVLFDGIGW